MHSASFAMPMQMHGYISGPSTPVLAYTMSCVGSALGLSAMSRARATSGFARWRWLALAAVSIGGTGIWVMHFIAMLGYDITGIQITYDLSTTIIGEKSQITEPSLAIARSDNTVTLSWPNQNQPFILQSNPSIGAAFENVTTDVRFADNRNTVTLPIDSSSNRFFRLILSPD